MNVELLISNYQLDVFPFQVDIDRYRLGIMWYNDLDFNFDYHVSIIKSPIPFKFGVRLFGNTDSYKFRLGKAKYKEGVAMEKIQIVDTTRINLREQIRSAFNRGAKAALGSDLNFNKYKSNEKVDSIESFTHADSLLLIENGLIEAPVVKDDSKNEPTQKTKNSKNPFRRNKKDSAPKDEAYWVVPKQRSFLLI